MKKQLNAFDGFRVREYYLHAHRETETNREEKY